MDAQTQELTRQENTDFSAGQAPDNPVLAEVVVHYMYPVVLSLQITYC